MPTKIISSKFIMSSPRYDQSPDTEMLEYVFIGRSNVGKSSLINSICEKKEFAKTSSKPGKTQLINYFEIESKDDEGSIQNWHLVDLPGYGYAKVTKSTREGWEDIISDYMRKRKQLAHVFVLIDSKLPPQKLDLEFISRLSAYNVPFSLVFTKSDKPSHKELSTNLKLFMGELATMLPAMPEYYVTSVEKKGSTQVVLEAIHKLNIAASAK